MAGYTQTTDFSAKDDLATGDPNKLVKGAEFDVEFSAISAAIGTKADADADLTAIAALANTDGNFIVGNGSTWVAESGATARASLGLGTAAVVDTGTAAGNVPLNSDVYGKQTIWIPAGAMVARTTNGAASGTAETTTNKVMLKTLDFDTATDEYAQFSVRMPKSWNESTVTAYFVWSHATTTTNFGVVFGLAGVALSDDDAADAAFGTQVTVADTGGTANDIYQTAETSAITIAGTPAAGDWVVFQVRRNVSDGSDTMAIDARLHGVVLLYTTDAHNDA